MTRKLSYVLVLLIVAASAAPDAKATDDVYLKINKSLQIFGDVFRQVSQNYVDDIEPEEFVRAGIDGMLDYLDPYTVFISEEESDEVDILTIGSYGGLGMTIAALDSALTITELAEGYAAEKAGMRVGDIIYKVDSTVVYNLPSSELRRFTRGKPGSPIEVSVIRQGIDDTLRFELNRQEISLKNVVYKGFVHDSIGYIRLERFSRRAPGEFRDALYELRSEKPLKGLIVDLRGNPGGLLESAVTISESFVPTGSPIVSTKGRFSQADKEYVSRNTPMEPTVPLAILMNGRSASASEIVAGAIQDLDRGILVGGQSFGKGLVQTVSSLPFNNTLKLTTAKYYTPSGRCIQRIDYAHRRNGIFTDPPDTSVHFYTKNGREVLQSSGVAPDTTVAEYSSSEFVRELQRQRVLFDFATIYAAPLDALPSGFAIEDSILERFKEYIIQQDFSYNADQRKLIEQLTEHALEEEYPEHILAMLDDLDDAYKHQKLNEFARSKAEIALLLYEEIIRRFHPKSEVIAMTLDKDAQLNVAASILSDQAAYESLVSPIRTAEE